MLKAVFKVMVGFIVFSMLMTAGSAYYLKNSHQDVFKSFKGSQNTGEDFGKKTDAFGCVREAMRRYVACQDTFQCHLANSLFLHSCLPSSQRNAHFCKEVPKLTDVEAAVAWQRSRCDKLGHPDVYCDQLFGVVIQYCTK